MSSDRGGSGEDRRSRVLLWLGGAVAAVLVLYLAAVLALRMLLPPETLARWAEPRAEAVLNRDVEIEGAELAVFPHLGVALRGLTVGNLPAFQGPPLARLDRAELRVAFLPLVRGDVVVDEAAARGLDLRLQVDEEGDSNFGDLLPASEEPGPDAAASVPLSLPIRDLSLQRGRVELRDRRTGRALVLDSLEASASLTREENGRVVRLEARSDAPGLRVSGADGELSVPGGAGAELRLRADERFRWVEVLEGRLTVGDVPASVAGRVDSLRSPVRRVDLTLRADSVRLARSADRGLRPLYPDPIEATEGTVSLRFDLTGPAGGDETPALGGRIDLRGVGASLAGRGRLAEGLSGTLSVRGDTLVVDRVEGTLLGGRARLTGRLERWPRLLADGDPRPSLRGSVRSARLDVGRLLRRPERDAGYGRLLFARLGGDSLGARGAAGAAEERAFRRPASLPASGSVALTVDTLDLPVRRLEALDARVRFGPGLIRVPEAEFVLDGGRVRQSFTLALGEGERQPFSFSMSGEGIRAGEFLAASTPLGRILTGTMSLDLRAAGLLDPHLLPDRDSLSGRGRLTVEGGGLSENPVTRALAGVLSYPALRSPSVERAEVPFVVRGSSVTFEGARLATSAGDLEWTGSVDLGGSVDVGARLRVPRSRLAELDLGGVGLPAGAVDRIRAGGGPLDVGLRVEGTVASPRFRPDPGGLDDRAGEAAVDAIRERLEGERDRLEERARSLLRGLGRDTVPPQDTAAGPGAAVPDTAPGRR